MNEVTILIQACLQFINATARSMVSQVNHLIVLSDFIQNYAAQVVLWVHRFSYIAPSLCTLNSLHVNRRINFKLRWWSSSSVYLGFPTTLRSTLEDSFR